MPISQSGGSGVLPLQETLQAPQGGNLIAATTQTATFNSPDFAAPACTDMLWFFVVTAISGTSPTVQFFVQFKDSAGGYHNIGLNTTVLSTVNTGSFGLTLASSTTPLLTPQYRVQAVIGGTTPSVSFFVDQYYK